MKRLFYIAIFGFLAGSLFGNEPTRQQQVRETIMLENPWLNSTSNGLDQGVFRESEAAFHWLFRQTHQGVPVYGGTIKVNTTKDGKRLHVFNQLKRIDNMLSTPLTAVLPGDVPMYYFGEDGCLPVLCRQIPNAKNEMEEWLLDAQGRTVFHRKLDLNFAADTVVRTKIFNPDPITTSQKVYGQNGLYKNNGGADAAELTAERKEVQLTLDFKNDSFFAASPYAIIRDLEAPVQSVFKSKTASFDFTRAQVFFRDMNCLYHIETYRKYLASIGIPLTGMPVLQVDPSAYAGQDQSRFSYSMSEPSLFFGTGGVADAEDADVIVHEYTHGINFFVAPNSLGGNQRLSLEEANADFMACMYSKGISDFNWRLVFNWDGHNEFWPGRNAKSSNIYPRDVTSDPYITSVIWSSMLNDLSDDLGRTTIIKLLFQSVASYSPDMTMQDAADLLMEADSLLFGFGHFEPLRQRLEQRGFFVYTGLAQQMNAALSFRLLNSEGFFLRGEHLKIISSSTVELKATVLDIHGSELGKLEGNIGEIEVDGSLLLPGIYFIHLQASDGSSAVVKIMRK